MQLNGKVKRNGEVGIEFTRVTGIITHHKAIRRIKCFIEEHYGKNLTLDVLAKEAGISKFYLQRIFRNTFHITPQHYITKVRIRNAKHLLLNTSLSVGIIGIMCGFNDVSGFSRSFRLNAGMSPSKFRKLRSDKN